MGENEHILRSVTIEPVVPHEGANLTFCHVWHATCWLTETGLLAPIHDLAVPTSIPWCQYCAWCGARVLSPRPGMCIHHQPKGCPLDAPSQTWIYGATLLELATIWPTTGVPQDLQTRIGELIKVDVDECWDAGPTGLAEGILDWARRGGIDETPF